MVFLILGLRLEHISPSLGINGNTSNPTQYTPRGATPLLAAQIEREIDELKTLFKVSLSNVNRKTCNDINVISFQSSEFLNI